MKNWEAEMNIKKIEQRNEIYKLLNTYNAENKASWWNIADTIVDIIADQEKRVRQVIAVDIASYSPLSVKQTKDLIKLIKKI